MEAILMYITLRISFLGWFALIILGVILVWFFLFMFTLKLLEKKHLDKETIAQQKKLAEELGKPVMDTIDEKEKESINKTIKFVWCYWWLLLLCQLGLKIATLGHVYSACYFLNSLIDKKYEQFLKKPRKD